MVYLELCRSFMDLATITKEKLSRPYVDKIVKYYRGRKYLTVNLENILRMAFEYEIPVSLLSPINQKGLWKIVFECLVKEIIRCVCHSFDKNTKDILKKTTEKIHEEISMLMNEFEELVGSVTQNSEKEKLTKVLIVLTTQEKQSVLDVFKMKEFKEDAYIVMIRGDIEKVDRVSGR